MLSQRLELEQKGLDKLFEAQVVTQKVPPYFIIKLMKHLKDNKKYLIEETLEICDET
jgi:uncharacterized protein with WD repeat